MLEGHRQLLNLQDDSGSLSQVHWVCGAARSSREGRGRLRDPTAGVGGGAAACVPVLLREISGMGNDCCHAVQWVHRRAALDDNPPSGVTRCVTGDC